MEGGGEGSGEKSMRRTFGKSSKVADRSGGNIRQSFLCKKCCNNIHKQTTISNNDVYVMMVKG